MTFKYRLAISVLVIVTSLNILYLLAAPDSQAPSTKYCTPIYLDIGHTPGHTGAISARGVTEYEFNKRFVSELQNNFSLNNSFKVEILGRESKNFSLIQRANQIKQLSSGILMSIHHDSVQPKYLREWTYKDEKQKYSDIFSGFSLFTSANSPAFSQSVSLAEIIGEELLSAGFSPSLHHNEPIPGENRPLLNKKIGLYKFDALAVLRHSKIPAVLIEVGLIVNRAEEEKLNDHAYRTKFQYTLASALKRFCERTNFP